MNWYRLTKLANGMLGQNLGKWLVLESRGQRDEVGVKNDIMTFVSQNPGGMDTSAARGAAISFFVSQTKQQPTYELTSLLDQWLSMVEGNSISPDNADQPIEETGTQNENNISTF